MAIDISELRKSNGELRASIRYFDQIQRANERLGRTQYQNIMKLNNELKFTVRYFESAYRTALKLSRLKLMPTVSLNDQASPALDRLLRKLNKVRDEAINASGYYTIKQKLDVFIKGLKIPKPGPINVTVENKSNSNLLALLGSGSKTEPAKEPESMIDKISKFVDLGKNIIEIPKSIDDSLDTIKKWLGKGDKSKESSNSGRAANGNQKCCCCMGGGMGNGKKPGKGKRGSGKGTNRQGPKGDSPPNERQGRSNKQGKNGRGSSTFTDRMKNAGKNIGQGAGKVWKITKGFLGKGIGAGASMLSTGGAFFKNIGQKAGSLAKSGWNTTKSLFQNNNKSSGIVSPGMDSLKNIGQKLTSGIGGTLGEIKDLSKGAGKGLLRGAGKIFRPLGAVMDIAGIATATSGKERGAAIGSAIAGTLGALGGGFLGSVVPGAGTVIGGAAGGTLMGMAGEWLGGKIGGWFDKKTPPVSSNTPKGINMKAAVSVPKAINAASPALPPVSTATTNASGKMQSVQLDSNQLNSITASLKDFKTEVTNAVSINIPPGAVQLTVKENELDYDALVIQIGQRVVNELRKSMQNRKSDSSGSGSAKPMMA